ncbi:hypothetical protein ACJ41O_006539 [Fusarium nematophilum]
MEPVLDILSLEPNRGRPVMNEIMIEAVDDGSIEVARLLLQRSADANSRGESGTLLWEACNQSDISMDLVELLVEHGADLESLGNNETPLERATRNGYLIWLEHLIERGARFNRDPESDSPPLGLAAGWGHLECVKCLLDNGAEIDWRDRFGESAVFEAADLNNYDIVDFLLEKGASASGQGWKGKSLVQMCLPRPTSVRNVLERCPETGQKDNQGFAPLHYAAQENMIDAIKVFLEFKAEVDIPKPTSHDHHTPLIMAASKESEESIRALLEGGADVDYKAMPWGCTALHHFNTAAILGALLEYRPDIDPTDKNGMMPLYCECKLSDPNLAIIHKFVNARANITAQTWSGMTTDDTGRRRKAMARNGAFDF